MIVRLLLLLCLTPLTTLLANEICSDSIFKHPMKSIDDYNLTTIYKQRKTQQLAASINGSTYTQNQMIGNATIKEIHPDKVVITKGNGQQTFTLELNPSTQNKTR
ncbi:MAG: hypothetical protein ACON5A_03455 [Candidatus Comchoanobacterales bacterium]